MVVILATVLAALFGAGDQYLGSLSKHPWLTDVSLISTPWLVLAFLAGSTQREPRRAVALGLVCTFSALLGYGLMTLSPAENAHLTGSTATAFVRSESRVFVGAVVTGPVFAWFGYRWRTGRAWLGALAIAAAFCLEPLAHVLAGSPIRSSTVSRAEVGVGIAIAVYIATASRLTTGRSA